MGSVFFEITLLVGIAAFLSIVFRFFRQPAILAYILTGIIIGPFAHLQLGHVDQLKSLAQVGVTLLLFMMGLEFKLKDLRSIGLTAGMLGVGQMGLTFLLGYAVSLLVGISGAGALYAGIALTFSSTIVIVKLLSDKKDLNSLYGKISVGLLLVQDVCAIVILMFLSTNTGSSFSLWSFLPILLKGVALFGIILYLSNTIFPPFINRIARSDETLFLFSLAWVFTLAGIVSSSYIGFPIEIGGFLAGLGFANSIEHLQVAARVRALRDFFITIFFVTLGMDMTFGSLGEVLVPALVLSAFVLLVKPIIVTTLMGLMGYRKRTSFLAGIVTSQISEFSLIIVFLGYKLQLVSSGEVSIITLVSIVTFAISTYFIMYGNKLYLSVGRKLLLFENNTFREKAGEEGELDNLKNHVVLVGSNRMGESILDALQEEGEQVVVIDFDPDVVERLKEKKVVSLFGDIADLDIQERAQLAGAKLVISTVTDVEDNLILIHNLNSLNKKTKVVVMAQEIEDANVLYKAGADYVVLPHLAGGRHLAKMIKDDTLSKLEHFKKKDAEYLK